VRWDRLIAPGDSWTPTIEKEFLAARCVIVLWSKASIHKHWLQVQGAKAARRRILISAVIDDVVPTFVFPTVRLLPLTDSAGELTFIGLQRLFADVGRKLGLPRQPLSRSVASATPSTSAVDGGDAWARLKNYPAGRRLLGYIDALRSSGGALTAGDVKSAQAKLIESLLDDHHSAPEVQRVLTRINNEMYLSIADSVCAQMVFDGWGDLPAPVTIMVMGSGGRGENYLLSDQDNGFIIGAYPDYEHLRIDAYFRQLAERMCHRLNDAGLPDCTGYCMAINPLWRKTLPQWFEQIAVWVRKRNFIALRLADIFFDFQPVWGNPVLAGELRAHLTQRTRSDPLFLRQMFREIKTSKVALGAFGNIATEKDERLDQGKVHLKYSGIVPLVEAGLIAYPWPLLIALFSALLPWERLRVHHVLGALLGLAGAALIVTGGGHIAFRSEYALGYGMALVCALTWSSYSVLSRRFSGGDRRGDRHLSCHGGARRPVPCLSGTDGLAGGRRAVVGRSWIRVGARRPRLLRLGLRGQARGYSGARRVVLCRTATVDTRPHRHRLCRTHLDRCRRLPAGHRWRRSRRKGSGFRSVQERLTISKDLRAVNLVRRMRGPRTVPMSADRSLSD